MDQGTQLEFQLTDGAENGAPELVIADRGPNLSGRGEDGRFQQGNRFGRNSLTKDQREALEKIRELAPKAAAKMGEMLDDDEVPAAAKIKILEMILERTYGKPEAALKLTTAQQSVEAAQARIAAIVSQIRIGDVTDE